MHKFVRKFIKRPPDITLPQQGLPSIKSDSMHFCDTAFSPRGVLVRKEETTVERDISVIKKQMTTDPFAWLHTAAPAFPLSGNNVKILYDPDEFYQLLLQKCQDAQNRITLASLYLGTGDLEKNLVQTIHKRMQQLNGQLKVTLLFDHSRGSRGEVNSRTLVLPLLKQGSQTCQVSLYHTVALRGLLKVVVPERYNELVGLQHMKLYLFDNSLVISGANLSNDYFTNRQDRYIMIEDCPELADFYSNLISRVCEFSLQLKPDGSTDLHTSWPAQCHPYKGDRTQFVEEARRRIWKTIYAPMSEARKTLKHDEDTWVFPLVQMGQLQVRHDSEVTIRLLESFPEGSHIHLTSGYFNLTNDLMEAILKRSSANFSILCAHPSANGFFNAKGLAGGIPAAYTQLAKIFFSRVCTLGLQNRIDMREYVRAGWTFHGKGLWLTLPDHHLPSLTLIGSPNFGSRSVERDLETQIAILTTNKNLQQRLAEERDRMYNQGVPISEGTFTQPDRIVPKWVYYASSLFKNYF